MIRTVLERTRSMVMLLWPIFSLLSAQSNVTVQTGANIDLGPGTMISVNSRTLFGTISGSGVWNLSPVSVEHNEDQTEDQQTAVGIPISYSLFQNYPNPFNPATTITYGILKESYVRLVVYNVLGQFVGELVSEIQSPGWKSMQWDVSVNSGVYFYRIDAVSTDGRIKFSDIKKMLVIR